METTMPHYGYECTGGLSDCLKELATSVESLPDRLIAAYHDHLYHLNSSDFPEHSRPEWERLNARMNQILNHREDLRSEEAEELIAIIAGFVVDIDGEPIK